MNDKTVEIKDIDGDGFTFSVEQAEAGEGETERIMFIDHLIDPFHGVYVTVKGLRNIAAAMTQWADDMEEFVITIDDILPFPEDE